MKVVQATRRLRLHASVWFEPSCTQRSVHYAHHWLAQLGATTASSVAQAQVVIVGGDVERDVAHCFPNARCIVRLWDFQVARAGSGVLAAAACGAAAAIGHREGPGVAFPGELPEKWCGVYGVILALAELWRASVTNSDSPVVYDVSAADIMRSFALQNGGSSEEIRKNWRRNGKRCIDHGGIFPMGFFECRDGHVAILGRSRRDWRNIRKAIGNPSWAAQAAYEDPFAIARDSETADALLEQSLKQFTRDELLERGLEAGAVIAPVYSQSEALTRDVFRPHFIVDGTPAMPFVVTPASNAIAAERTREFGLQRATGDATSPLAGLRCIELCWVWSGPMVGQILADLGAEVIKVESHTRFDLYRTRGVEMLRGKMVEAQRIESSLHFHSLNRNKIGCALDLKQPEHHREILQLVSHSQLLIENFTVGTLQRLGLGFDNLTTWNPQLVQLSMSGPGRGSAVESLRSYGLVLSALAGVEALIESNGEFVGSPTFSISDPNAAAFATMSALAGVLSARQHGVGCALDLSQIEAAATLAGTPMPPPRMHEAIMQASDGAYVAFSVPCRDDPESNALKRYLTGATSAQIRERCQSLGGHSQPLIMLADTERAPEFIECSGWCTFDHPVTGTEQLVAAPWRVNGVRPPIRRAAPRLGEHNDYVLREVLKVRR